MHRDRHSHDHPTHALAGARRDPFRPEVLLRIAWRRKWHITLPALIIAAAASWWIHRLPNRYRSEALLLVAAPRVPETFVRSTVATRSADRLQLLTQQVLSRTELERIIRDFDLYADSRQADPMQDIVDSMRARDIEIRPVKGDAFRLGFTARSPQVAMLVVERLVSLFIVQSSLDRATLADGADQFLEAQLEDARRKLIDNESKLAAYRRRHNGQLPTQLEANVRGLHNTELQLQALADALNRDRDRQLALERSLKDASLSTLIELRVPTASNDTAKASAAEQLERAEVSLEEMRSTLTEQHPDVVTLKQTIAELRKRKATDAARQVEPTTAGVADQLRRSRVEELRAELTGVERQIAQKTAEEERLRTVLLSYQQRIEDAPTRETELAVLTRDYDTLQQTYRALLAKKQESAIAANLERQVGGHFKVLDPPRLPEEPFAPNRTRLYAVGVVAGLAIGVFFAAIIEYFDRKLRTKEEVRLALRLPVLAAIPLVVPPRRRVFRAALAMSAVAGMAAGVAALAWRLFK